MALAALRTPRGHHVWNVAEPVSPSEAEWAGRIAEILGWRGRIVESEAEDAPGFNADQPIVLSDARIREELGYGGRYDPAEGLADNVRRYVDWRAARSAGACLWLCRAPRPNRPLGRVQQEPLTGRV